MTKPETLSSNRVRDTSLKIASDLFYHKGVHAVGMDMIVKQSGIAKTSIYRHFPTKDALIEAFLKSEDADFWSQWNGIVAAYSGQPAQAIFSLCDWIGEKVSQNNYRGCPQINVAAEFADPDHPARKVAKEHKAEMVKRLTELCSLLDTTESDIRAQQISLLFDGAFMSYGRLGDDDVDYILKNAVQRLLGI